MEEQFLNEILKDTYTLESFRKRVLTLKHSIEKKVYNSEPENSQKDQVAKVEFDNLLEGVTSNNFPKIFKRMEAFVSQGSVLTIYFVFLPDENQIKEIGQFLRKSLDKPDLVFDVKVDPSLIGGCAIVYKGVYKDYSLKAKINANKEKLVEQFRKYFKN